MTGRSSPKKWLSVALVSLTLVILIVMGAASKAKRYVPWPALLHPQARQTLLAFQTALNDHTWEKALALCSDPVQAAARRYASPGEFFNAVVPVAQILPLRAFNITPTSYKGTRRLEVPAYRWRVPVAEDPEGSPMSQVYEVINNDGRWQIVCPCEPLDAWMEEICRRRQVLKGQLAQVAKAMARLAAEERGDTPPTDEFLAQKQREGLAAQKKRAEQRRAERLVREQRLATLMPRVEGVDVVLKAERHSYRMSEPMPLTLELVSRSDSPLYYQFGTTGCSLTVLDDRGRFVACKQSGIAMNAAVGRLQPGQRVVLCESYDIAESHAVDRTGRYTVEFNGHMLSLGDTFGTDPNEEPLYAPVDWVSNSVRIEVLP